ncbi:MAG TPA: adenylate/guanylate cyclase domain-containing protein [Alphaproteobacteria bacterium]|nr:adenylate/guanylate cyclase domain-containing protein [Alphaproteobacteria bacterium]
MIRKSPAVIAADRERRLDAAMALEERAGARIAAWARGAVALVISAYILANWPQWPSAFHLGFLAMFGLLGVVQYQLHRRGWFRGWMRYAFLALDIGLLTYQLLVPNPFDPNPLPAAMQLRMAPFDYFFVLLAFTAFSFAPALAVAAGAMTAALWGLGALWVALQPGSFSWISFPVSTQEEYIARQANPWFVDVAAVTQQAFVFCLVAGILTLSVWRSRRLLRQQLESERERANLSRYFSPNVVEELARLDDPLGMVAAQPCAVMFVDIVGFTRLCESMPPQEVIALLRAFHRRIEKQIFAHGGTLDKYIGDGVMATFGTPRPGDRDATNALLCACAVVEEIAGWAEERRAEGRAPFAIGIGVHYGQVVVGDVGGERCYEFTVVGDTVNVASRLEKLTRELGVPLVASDAAVAAAIRESGAPPVALSPGPVQALRGREEAMRLWVHGGAAPQAAAG